VSSDDHMQSSLVLSRPILFRQPSKNKEDGFLHSTLDCINVFPFHMVNSEAPPLSTSITCQDLTHNMDERHGAAFFSNFSRLSKWGVCEYQLVCYLIAV